MMTTDTKHMIRFRELELTIAGVGYNGHVKFDGEDVCARAFTISSRYDEVTTVQLDMLAHDWEPFTLRGIFIPDTDPDYAEIMEVLNSPVWRHELIKRTREREGRLAALQAEQEREEAAKGRDVTVIGDDSKGYLVQ